MNADVCKVAPLSWTRHTISDVCSKVTSGGTPSRKIPQHYHDGRWPWVKSKELLDCWIDDTEEHITEGALQYSSAKMLPSHTVLLALYGATVGQLGILRKPMTCNQACCAMVVDEKKADYRYVFYQLLNHRAQLKNVAIGAAQQNLSGDLIKSLCLPFPPVGEQKAIANILGSLDDKIELNRRMNETLEAMARAIFKSWFVDFDPVRAKAEGRKPAGMNTETAKMFPDSFEDSELGKIPRGWKLGCLGDIAENPRRGVNAEEIEPCTPYIGLEHMPRRSIALDTCGTVEEVKSNKFKYLRGEILFGKLRPYFHKVGVAVEDGICSTDILVIRPKSAEWFGYILFCVSSTNFVDYTDAHSTGTKMPRTNWKDMSNYKTVLSPADLAAVFDQMIVPTVDSIRNNVLQSRTLASTRDALLPKLLSGEIRVKDAEKFCKETCNQIVK